MKANLIYKVIILLTVLNSSIYSQQQDNWKWMNPKPQGNSLFGIDFMDNANGYAAGQYGTILKTSDGGNSWNKLNSGTTKYIFSIDFLNANTGYIGGDKQMIRKTTDGGQTWISLNLPVEISFDTLLQVLDINFVTPEIGYATGQFSIFCKLWKTTNGGLNWVSQNINNATYLKRLYFHDENNGIAVGGIGVSEIIKTTNGGINWQFISNVPGQGLDGVTFINANTGFVGGVYGYVNMTTNAGNTWLEVGSPTSMDITSMIFINANTGFGFGKGNAYVKSTNGGLTWTDPSLGFSTVREFYDAELTPDGTIHAVGSYGIMMRSTNQGTSFFSLPSVTEKSVADIHFADASTGYAVCDAPDGDIIKTTNAGVTWVSQISGYTPPQRGVTFLNGNTGYAVGSFAIKKTTNGGSNWIDIHTHPSNTYWGVTFLNDNTGYVVGGSFGNGPFVSKTTDAGSTWNYTSFDPGFISLTTIRFTDLNNGYAIGGGNMAIRTTNGGASWINMTVPGSSYSSISFKDLNTGYISSFSDGIKKTTNSGNSWFSLTVPSGEQYYDVQFRGDIGYAVTNSGKIIKTINGGNTWSVRETVTQNPLYTFFFNSDNYIYTGGSYGTLLKSIPAELLTLNTSLDLTLLIEGLYNPNTNSMVSDSVKVYLRNSSVPYALTDSAKGILSAAGNATFNFSNVSTGQYYIVVNHRNSIETWSRQGGEAFTSGGSINYNMSDLSTKAYGNNLKQVDSFPVRFADYSGDVNQDGNVDLTDMINIYNNAVAFVSGYNETDINGDNITDLTDLVITNNNSIIYAGKITP